MSSLGFVHLTSKGQKYAGLKVMENVREFYPNAFYMVINDAGENRVDDCIKYNAEYYHSQKNIGYPQEPYGYSLENVLEWLERFYIACLRTDTTHLLFLEDDIHIIKTITFPEDVEIYSLEAGYPDGSTFTNGFPKTFIQHIYDYSGVWPNVNSYNASGGTIYNVKTFKDNYVHVIQWLKDNFDNVRLNIYPKMGWQDCFGTYFYLLSGKRYTKNPNFCNVYDLENTKEFDYYGHYEYPREYIISKDIPSNIEHVHNYKKYYI
jgi:hypothetical protein